MRPIDAKLMTDTQIVEIVQSFDRQGLPLARRFEGDDQALRDFVIRHEIKDVIANMAVVMVIILREAAIRGLIIPPVN
jgi:N-acetylglutamate synthase-like GNAT family acetyltransferase